MLCIIVVVFSMTVGEAPSREEIYILLPSPPPLITKGVIDDRISDLDILHPTFRNKVVRMLYECAKQGINLEVVETYRTPERQNELRRKGYSMLHGGKSKHQHHIAIDVVPVKYGWYMWHDRKLWKKIGEIGKKNGLIWGGDWRFYDPGHFEYNISIDSINYVSLPDTVIIPIYK